MENDQKTILIVEDEEDLMTMYDMALTNKKLEVLQAKNGLEAMEWLEKKYAEIDLVLLDIVMPDMDGFETLQKIKKDERFSGIPVVIFTNLDNEEDKKQAEALGADGYFVKSRHTPAELVDEVNKILGE